MEMTLQVIFRNMPHSASVGSRIRHCAERLERFCDAISGCRVALEAGHHDHRAHNPFQVRVEVFVPGEKLVVNHEPDAHHAQVDVFVTIREAFDAMRRQLEDYARSRRR